MLIPSFDSTFAIESCDTFETRLSSRSNSAAFFRDVVSVAESQVDFDLNVLKAKFMDQYAGTYWRATSHNRLFAIGYIDGEEVKAFLDRFSAAAHQADIDLASEDPELKLLKNCVVAKVPDSVKRLIR